MGSRTAGQLAELRQWFMGQCAPYSYDGVGNRLSEVITSGATTTRVLRYPAGSNQLSGVTENGAALRTFTYDNGGNIVSDARPGETFAFTNNVRNRPITITRNGAACGSYLYNGLEQLMTRTTSAPGGPVGTVHYIHDLEGHVIAEADGAPGWWRQHRWSW